MIKSFLTKINFQRNKKIIFGALVLIVILFGVYSFLSVPAKNSARQEMALTIPAFGMLPELKTAMKKNGSLRGKVSELVSYDKSYLFTNYLQVNDTVIDIMFLWAGLTTEQIEAQNRQKLSEYFIRYVHDMPKDAPIKNNPLLDKHPWAGLFQKMKAKLLMQGQGHKIYNGVAYYDSTRDKMVVEGGLSKAHAEALSVFIKTQPTREQKKYINNYLMFVDETLGLKNLNDNEKSFLKKAGFL